jgi:plastocyanin
LRKILTITLLLTFSLLLYLPSRVLAGTITGTVHVRGLRSPANVLVYIAKAPDVHVDVSAARFIMDQRDLTFVPHVLPVLVGSKVQFPNNDKVAHNVFSLSRTKPFNLGSYGPGVSKTVLFDKAGVVELRCDVHAEMSAYILVMENPYWALTDEEGRFKIPDQDYLAQHGIKGIKDLPSGTYVVKTWNEKLKTQEATVVVPKDGEVTIQLDLTRGAPSALYK